MGEEVLRRNTETRLAKIEFSSGAELLNQWIFETIRPFLKGRILEVGSGIGRLAECFLRNAMPLHVSDPTPHYCQLLQKRFESEQIIKGIHQIKLAHDDFETKYAILSEQFDTVIVVNTVEHVPHDQRAFTNAKKLLRTGGYLIALTPARTALYNESEYGLREWKRYNRQDIRKLLGKDLEAIKTQYFNVISAVRWILARSQAKAESLEAGSENQYDQEVPVFRIADETLFHRLGLSVIAIRKKTKLGMTHIN